MRSAPVAFVIAALVGMTSTAAAQGVATAQTGTIAGVVVSTDSQPQPIGRAVVTLTGGGIQGNLSTIADQAGRFRFVDIVPGRYGVTVSKPAYLTMAYGARRPGRPGTSLAIAAGQNLEITVPLPRGGVITGTVRDQFGQAVPGASINIAFAGALDGASTVMSLTQNFTTDDRGVYRAFGLMPDDYVVAVVPGRLGLGMSTEVSAPTRAEVDGKLSALAQQALGREAAETSGQSDAMTYAPIYYPGTPLLSNATRIHLNAGDERTAVDIQMAPARSARISGVVNAANIPPQGIRVTLGAVGPPLIGGFMPFTPVTRDGTFSIPGVAPGRYTLSAQYALPGPQGVAAQLMYASTDLNVDGADISGLALVLRPAPLFAGRVQFDATSLKPPQSLDSIRVSLSSAGPRPTVLNGLILGGGTMLRATTKEDGTFSVPGVLPGSYTFTASVNGWWLKSVVFNGRDILDYPLDVDGSADEYAGAIATFSDRRSELRGSLSTQSGEPASEYVVIVYPADRSMWKPGARRIRSVRPASDGAFALADLPAGDYLLAAITDADPDEWQKPAFLEQLLPASVKITIAEGQKVRQDLRIAR